MSQHRYRTHYSLEQARALLPRLRAWLERMADLQRRAETYDKQLSVILERGDDAGGSMVNNLIKTLTELRGLFLEFHQREIQIKDVQRGLIDFPAIIGGKEVFLCWERDEDDIEFWHDLDSGYAGREPI